MLDFGKTSCNDFVLAQIESLRLFGAPNETLRLITIFYNLKYSFGIKTTYLQSLQSQNNIN